MKFAPQVEEALEIAKEILVKKITVHIYSTPSFSLEIFIGIVICLMYSLLQSQVGLTRIKKVVLKPALSGIFNNINSIDPPKESDSQDSVTTSLVICNTTPQYENSRKRARTPSPDRCNKSVREEIARFAGLDIRSRIETNEIQKFLALTPNQFVKIDKEKKRLKSRQGGSKSLATLYNTTMDRELSEDTIKRHIELAKEHLELAKMSKDVRSNLKVDVDKVTGSLFSLLERIITTSSLEKPFPFRGDIAGLAVDMANLSLDVDPGEFGDGDSTQVLDNEKDKKPTAEDIRRHLKIPHEV